MLGRVSIFLSPKGASTCPTWPEHLELGSRSGPCPIFLRCNENCIRLHPRISPHRHAQPHHP
jgi:hypothetical protein